MASFSPLVAILNQNKLTSPNYVDWKRNLDIVLLAEEHKFVLSEPCPGGDMIVGGNLMRWLSVIS